MPPTPSLSRRCCGREGSVIVYGTGTGSDDPGGILPGQRDRIQFFLVYELDAAERERAVCTINARLSKSKLINRVAKPTFPLDDIAAAHEAVERGTSAM